MHKIAILCPNAQKEAANNALENVGLGPNNFSILLTEGWATQITAKHGAVDRIKNIVTELELTCYPSLENLLNETGLNRVENQEEEV
jgi:hypothetical protein